MTIINNLYTLNESYNLILGNEIDDETKYFDYKTLEDFIADDMPIETDIYLQFKYPTLIEKLWQAIFSKYGEEDFTLSINHHLIAEELPKLQKQIAKRFISMFNIMLETEEYYGKVIEIYESEKNNLMNKLNSSTNGISRFNDTPQDEGDFANDEHTSSLTQTEASTSNDVAYTMNKIKDIQESYKRIWEDWLREFQRLFIEN